MSSLLFSSFPVQIQAAKKDVATDRTSRLPHQECLLFFWKRPCGSCFYCFYCKWNTFLPQQYCCWASPKKCNIVSSFRVSWRSVPLTVLPWLLTPTIQVVILNDASSVPLCIFHLQMLNFPSVPLVGIVDRPPHTSCLRIQYQKHDLPSPRCIEVSSIDACFSWSRQPLLPPQKLCVFTEHHFVFQMLTILGQITLRSRLMGTVNGANVFQ